MITCKLRPRKITFKAMAALVCLICLYSIFILFLSNEMMRDLIVSSPIAYSSSMKYFLPWKYGWTVKSQDSSDKSESPFISPILYESQIREHLLFSDSDFNIIPEKLRISSYRLPSGSALILSPQSCGVELMEGREKKFFTEIYMTWHLDGRFGKKTSTRKNGYTDEERGAILRQMFACWADFADSRYIPYNIAHGLLLGWTWGQKIMPWDDDLDVQVPSEYLNVLLSLSNQTFCRRYLLEVNPRFNVLSPEKKTRNTIEGRFIDTKTGYFMDITGLYFEKGYNVTEPLDNFVLRDKNWHTYRFNDFYPLIRTSFEGIQTWIPFNTTKYLTEEYGEQGTPASFKYTHKRSWKSSEVKRYRFNPYQRRWMRA